MEPWLTALAVLLLALLAWLRWVPLMLTARGVASTERDSEGRVTLDLWPLSCSWAQEPALRELRVAVFGLTVWRGEPPRKGRVRDRERARRKRPRLPSRQVSVEIARFVRAQAHRVDLRLLDGELRFAFEDPDVTGRCVGALYVLRGRWPGATREFRFAAQWAGATQVDAHGTLRLRVFVGRMLLSGVRLGLRLLQLRDG